MPCYRCMLSVGLAQAIDERKKLLSLISATLLAMSPWMQISKAAADGAAPSFAALLIVIAAGLAIHVAYLLFNATAVDLLGLGGMQEPSGRCPPTISWNHPSP